MRSCSIINRIGLLSALALVTLLTSCLSSLSAEPSASANNSPNLRDDWIDSDTGHRVVRLSRIPGRSESFYFHQNAFTPKGDKFVFSNTSESGRNRLFLLDWATRKAEPLTESGAGSAVVSHTQPVVYYQRSSALYSTHLETRDTKKIADLPPGWSAGTINADDTLLAGTFVAGGPPVNRTGPRSGWFEQTFEAKRPQCLFTVEVATGKTNIFYRYPGWLGHIQFSPTDPQLLMFCHEGPWHKLDRIWQIHTDGTGVRLMHERTVTNEIAGHEFWSVDGKMIWFDLQMPRSEKFFLAGAPVYPAAGPKVGDAKGQASPHSAEIRYPLERDQWSVHFNISRDGHLFAGDGGAPNMVARARDGKWLYLFTPRRDGTLRAERLVNMSKHDYALEPNVNFSPDGKWIIFRGNFDGVPQVYAVEVARPH
jgi:oligogalacturonide lyase